MKNRKHRSHSEWLSIIQQFKSSGCTPAAFCQQQNLDYKYFLKRKRSLESKDSAFVKVQTSTAKQIMPSTDLMLQYQNTRLHLSTAIDAQWLAQLMRSLA
ncbi:MAG: hypothetical protein RQ783_07755 [Gammaproteobacteria bacterium]|nr:hypothetical protein [Gammaproteobacteria bacterium]